MSLRFVRKRHAKILKIVGYTLFKNRILRLNQGIFNASLYGYFIFCKFAAQTMNFLY